MTTEGAVVSGCRVSHVTNYDGVVVGFYYGFSVEIATSDCHADNCQSHFGGNIRSAGHTVLGFMPLFCFALTYDDCSASNITGSADDCHGMSVFLDADVIVRNFTAHTVTDGVTPKHTGAKATGLEVYGTNIMIENCAAENIKAINPQDKQATGFSAWGADITFSGCKATTVSVCDEHGRQNASLGYGTGFGWAPDPRLTQGAYMVTYVGCLARNCQVGFDTWYHVDSTWSSVRYDDCGINILIQPGESRTPTANPAPECNPPVSVTLRNIAQGNTFPSS